MVHIAFGEYIRILREEQNLPIRKVAAAIDIDPSTLSKIERGERLANKQMLPFLSDLFNVGEEDLSLILLSDKVVHQVIDEKNSNKILEMASKKIKYLKNKSQKQGKLDFEKYGN